MYWVVLSQEAERRTRALLERYANDRTNRFDFALESAGGSVLTVRCTPTYKSAPAVWELFGIPLYYFYRDPRTLIIGVSLFPLPSHYFPLFLLTSPIMV